MHSEAAIMAEEEEPQVEDKPGEEKPLLLAAGRPEPPSRAKGGKVPEKVPETPSGENAGIILGQWVKWYQDRVGVPLPASLIARIGKQVKVLISTGYTTDEIKFGLAAWTLRQWDNPALPPNELDMLTFNYARDTRPGAAEFRRTLQASLLQVSNGTYRTGNRKADRETSSLTAISNYRRKGER